MDKKPKIVKIQVLSSVVVDVFEDGKFTNKKVFAGDSNAGVCRVSEVVLQKLTNLQVPFKLIEEDTKINPILEKADEKKN